MSIWEDPDSKHSGACTRRVFTGTLDARLLAVDAGTGEPCKDFGTGGQVDLTNGLRIFDKSDYLVTSPPAITAMLLWSAPRSATTGRLTWNEVSSAPSMPATARCSGPSIHTGLAVAPRRRGVESRAGRHDRRGQHLGPDVHR